MTCLDIKTQETEICDCMMASLAHAAMHFNRDYQFLFAGTWVFSFKPNGEKNDFFWQRLHTPMIINTFEILKKYHGIHLIEHNASELSDAVSSLREVTESELSRDFPLVIEFDLYNCPWSEVYKKANIDHYSLVIGIDENKENFICIDPFVIKDAVKLPVAELREGLYKFFTLRLDEPECDIADWRSVVKTVVDHNYKCEERMNTFDMMRCFASEILQSEDFTEELRKQNDAYTYELFYQLKFMYQSRLNYSWFIEYISTKCNVPELMPIAKAIAEASSLWKTVWLKFMKIAYIDQSSIANKTLKNISERLMKIADIEETATRDILNILG